MNVTFGYQIGQTQPPPPSHLVTYWLSSYPPSLILKCAGNFYWLTPSSSHFWPLFGKKNLSPESDVIYGAF